VSDGGKLDRWPGGADRVNSVRLGLLGVDLKAGILTFAPVNTTVGNMFGGLAVRYMGGILAPSNR
jgi:hypothetical protein